MDIAQDFLAGCDHKPSFACLAVAGVVSGRTVTLTNLPWVIDCSSAGKTIRVSAGSLNKRPDSLM